MLLFKRKFNNTTAHEVLEKSTGKKSFELAGCFEMEINLKYTYLCHIPNLDVEKILHKMNLVENFTAPFLAIKLTASTTLR